MELNMPTAWNNHQNLPKIAICIPYRQDWNPEWVEKIYIPLLYKQTNFCQKVAFLCKAPSLPVSRDMLVKQALQANSDYIFFMDTDNLFEEPSDPNEALRLLFQRMNKSRDSKDSKIVSALYRAKKDTGFNYSMWIRHKDGGFVPIVEWKGNWLDVDTVGFGCCLIDVEVFKNIPRPYFRWEESGEMSEDFYFCQLAKKHGYNTHVLTDVKLSHLAIVKVKCDGDIINQDI